MLALLSRRCFFPGWAEELERSPNFQIQAYTFNAAKLATEKQAYSIWGVTAFLKWQETSHSRLQLVIPSDSLMQRVMVCVVVSPKKFPKTNIAGATALEQYLRAPQTQALIHTFRIPGIAQPVFLPAG